MLVFVYSNIQPLLYSVVGQIGDDENVETSASSRCCAGLLVVFSVLLIILFFPFSMFYVVKVRINNIKCRHCNLLLTLLGYTRISKSRHIQAR